MTICAAAQAASASWYWPFGDDEDEQPRISEIMEPATLLIESASDLATDGKIPEAVAEYKRALLELNRIELEHPERADTPDFATLRNKRAYVNAAIDSLLLKQAKDNARAVAVTDTTELEKRYARKKKGQKLAEEDARAKPQVKETKPEKKVAEKKPAEKKVKPEKAKAKQSKSMLQLAAEDLLKGEYDAALLAIEEVLAEKPNDARALNLRAAVEAELGDFRKAERTLDQSIQSNPKSYYAYYNMARLFLRTRGASGKSIAKLYYETGRQYGGPEDANLEAQIQ